MTLQELAALYHLLYEQQQTIIALHSDIAAMREALRAKDEEIPRGS